MKKDSGVMGMAMDLTIAPSCQSIWLRVMLVCIVMLLPIVAGCKASLKKDTVLAMFRVVLSYDGCMVFGTCVGLH